MVGAADGEAFNGRPVLDVFFYRAMPSSSINKWRVENMDMASTGGVTKYVHTEVIAESIIGSPERETRKYHIDAIAKYPMKIKNPSSVTASSSSIVTQVHFGPFVTYDYGVATNLQTQTMIEEYGSFVGVQSQYDPRWPHSTPYFWFSVTGWCPSVAWWDRPVTREEAEQIMSNRTSLCPQLEGRIACDQNSDDCVYENGRCLPRDPAPRCLNYTSSRGKTSHVLGGLCPGGHHNLVEPTGEHGCTYSYGRAESVTLDEVAGILEEDCGGRKCTGWLDFRHNCTNPEYRQKFNWETNQKEPFKYCIEYDISPPCQADCTKAECQSVPESEKEIGLPFWRGRCKDEENIARAAKVEASFPAPQAKISVATTKSTSCVFETPGICAPAPGQGGNYCTRQWGGICSNCYVPGTQVAWPATHMAYCPYDILSSPDYESSPHPTCSTSNPRDLCCLYTGECSLTGSDLASAPLDEDGFALVVSSGNSSAVATFLARVVESHGRSTDPERLASFAETQTGSSPRKGASLEIAIQRMTAMNISVDRTTIVTSTATSTTSFTTTTTTSMGTVPFLDIRTGGEHQAPTPSLNPSAGLGLNDVISSRDEAQGSSLLAILISFDVFGGILSIGSVVAGVMLLQRHLSGWPRDPQARTDAWKLVLAAMASREHVDV